MLWVDLHTHTNASDGTDTPAALVKKAHAAGLAAVAITDHDTVAGLAEAEDAGRALGITVIRGCELSTSFDGGEAHILGLFLPKTLTALEERLAWARCRRDERNGRMVERLRDLGLDVSMSDVRAAAGGESVGRPHIAAALVARGHVKDSREAFREYLGARGKAYLPKENMAAEEAVRLLADLGATACLAHPLLRNYPLGTIDDFVARLKAVGLAALEVYHSEHSDADTRLCLGLARRFDLGISGGSDYHGAAKPGIRLGVGYGGLRVGQYVLEDLLAQRRLAGLPEILP